MPYFTNVEINLFAIALLYILFRNTYRHTNDLLPDQKLFLYMLVSTAFLLTLDAIQWAVDGRPGVFLRDLNIIAGMFYYMFQVFPCIFWGLYVRYQTNMNEKETMRVRYLFFIPFFFSAVMSVLSCFNGLYFYVDQNNVYHRGPFFWLFAVIILGYLVDAYIFILVNRKKLGKKVYGSLLVFALPPFIGGMIQTFIYGASLLWPAVSLSLLIIFINIQNNQLYTDHLTGLYNRRQLDIYLDGCQKKNGHGGSIGGIMLDVDEFKSINDAHGHTVGDQALIQTAVILKKSVGKNSFIARYGGDEFVVFFHAEDRSELDRMVETIEWNVTQYNQQNHAPYHIRLSMGYDLFDCGAGYTKEQVLSRIDRLMYAAKHNCRQ